MGGMVIAFPGNRAEVHGNVRKRRASPSSPNRQLKVRVERIAALLDELEDIAPAEVSAMLGQARTTFRKVEERLASRGLSHPAPPPAIVDERDSQPDVDREVLERHFHPLDR